MKKILITYKDERRIYATGDRADLLRAILDFMNGSRATLPENDPRHVLRYDNQEDGPARDLDLIMWADEVIDAEELQSSPADYI